MSKISFQCSRCNKVCDEDIKTIYYTESGKLLCKNCVERIKKNKLGRIRRIIKQIININKER